MRLTRLQTDGKRQAFDTRTNQVAIVVSKKFLPNVIRTIEEYNWDTSAQMHRAHCDKRAIDVERTSRCRNPGTPIRRFPWHSSDLQMPTMALCLKLYPKAVPIKPTIQEREREIAIHLYPMRCPCSRLRYESSHWKDKPPRRFVPQSVDASTRMRLKNHCRS